MIRSLRHAATGAAAAAVVATQLVGGTAQHVAAATAVATATPIKHLIVIIGENHSFDNVFATYKSPTGSSVRNLLSEGIVTANGGLGPNVGVALQATASDRTVYRLTPTKTGTYATLPQPNTTYVSTACDGLPADAPDSRFPTTLANGPYQITKYVPYDDNHNVFGGGCEFYGAYVGDPIHRFYQMWQQVNKGSQQLQTWTANTAGDDNGAVPPAPIFQGALQMGYYNMAAGDAPILRFLADHYAISNNYHQAVMGGTGANHIAIGTADAAFYQDTAGNPTVPPANEIENPNPKPGTNNNFTQDGYAGGSYSNCSDRTQPGVGAVRSYLSHLAYSAFRNGDCQSGAYYLLNNYNPGYNVDGTLNTAPFTVPPQRFPTIADELQAAGITWGYYGEGYNNGTPTSGYCGICDPFQYATSVMANPAKRVNIQHDSSAFDAAVASGNLPAVTFLKPGDDDGHPGYSTLAAFESFVAHAVTEVQNQKSLWKNTAIVVTMDETGGYYDSGYIQPISFFGDGPRVPLMVISPFTKPGFVDHTYEDHASIVKFIEANWHLGTLSNRSWDNLPNPANSTDGGYVPGNGPAIGDLMSLFDFSSPQATTATVHAGSPLQSGGVVPGAEADRLRG